MSDRTLAIINDLAEPAATSAYWLVYAARVAGYPVVITSGRRTLEEQAQLVSAGASRDPRSPHTRGLAFDIDWYGWHRDDVPSWFWNLIGPWAELHLQLTWGGRWTNPYDPGHFQTT